MQLYLSTLSESALPKWIQSLEVLTEFLVVLSALGGLTLFRLMYGWWILIRKRRAADAPLIGFETCVILDHLREVLGGDRALILRAHNGGSDISATKPLYTSVMFQKTGAGVDKIEWKSVPVEDDYWKLLRDLEQQSDHSLVLSVEDLTPGSALRNQYESAGIRHSYVFKLYTTPKELWYVSINRTHPVQRVQDPVAGDAIRVARRKLVRALRDGKVSHV